jgi:hypothetical protein
MIQEHRLTDVHDMPPHGRKVQQIARPVVHGPRALSVIDSPVDLGWPVSAGAASFLIE